MATRRKIIRIDEEECDGCGLCVPACAEGALQIVDGKAKLVSESYCDGLGACVGWCPRGAIDIEEREVGEFDTAAAAEHLREGELAGDDLPCACSSSAVAPLERKGSVDSGDVLPRESMLGHWPVQLSLVPPGAPFLQDADLLLVAGCVPFAYADFHRDFLSGHAVLVACPKLDDFRAHQVKLSELLLRSRPRSLTVLRMGVMCCSGLVTMARQAIRDSGSEIPFGQVVVGVKGDIKLSEE